MYAVVLPLIFFVADVQVSAMSAYPDSIATIISGQVGTEAVYDCGDLVEHGGFLEAQEYDRYRELFPRSVPVPGNHDHYNGLLEWTWPSVVDTFDCGIHIVGFDSGEWNNAVALDSLQAKLDDGDEFTILYLHHQIFSDNLRNGDIADFMRPALLPLIERTEVDLVISGHGHAFEHHLADGTDYLVIGGAGAPLDAIGTSSTNVFSASVHHWLEIYPGENEVRCEVKGLDGLTVYSFEIEKGVTPTNDGESWGSVKSLYR